MKRALSVLLVFGLALSLFAAGNAEKETIVDDGKVTLPLVLMTKDSTTAGFKEWLQKVKEACNLDITVVATPTNSSDRQAKITTILSTADKNVDIITINDEMYSAFKNTGWLANLNEVMTSELINEYPTTYMKEMVITNGNTFSVPMYFSVYGWFVNKKIMKEVGFESINTWDDFQALAKAATNANRYGYGDAWDPTYVFNSLGSFINLFGGDYYDWKNPKTKAGVEAMLDLLQKGYTTNSQMADQFEQLYQHMLAGDRAVALLYTNQINKFKKAGAYEPEGPIQMVLPPVADKTIGATAYCSSWHYVLNGASPNKVAAMRFLKYAASEQGQLDYTMTFGTYPAYLSLLNKPELDKLSGIEEMRMYLKNVTLHARPIVPEAMEYISEIGNLFQKLVLGQIDVDFFCNSAQESTNKFI